MSHTTSPRELGPCPVCGQGLSRPLSACGSCHTPHHADCWDYNEGCAIYGCGAKPAALSAGLRFSAESVVPRVAFLALFLTLAGLFASGSRPLSVQLEELAVDVAPRSATATFLTSPRSRCTVEIVRADAPDVVVARRRTGRSLHHRVTLSGLRPGGLYLMRVTTQGVLRGGQTHSQLFRTPDEPRPAITSAGSPTLTFTPTPGVRDPLRLPLAPVLEPARRDPFKMPPMPLAMRVAMLETGTVRAPDFSAFEIKVANDEALITWKTKAPMALCRVLVSRDASLKGVERVVDAVRGNGTSHKVTLAGLTADASYQVLVLGFPAAGEPIQSPVVAFRTLAH